MSTSLTTDWVDEVIAGWKPDDVPDRCQQFGCKRSAATWCPLCRAYFCHEHDELYPRRKHDCLRGKADA
jgi:predicted nucleic acid binding AN1-type Zn finger protein